MTPLPKISLMWLNLFTVCIISFLNKTVNALKHMKKIIDHNCINYLRHNQINNKSICQPIFHHPTSANWPNRLAMRAIHLLAWWKISMATLDLLFIFMCLELRRSYSWHEYHFFIPNIYNLMWSCTKIINGIAFFKGIFFFTYFYPHFSF